MRSSFSEIRTPIVADSRFTQMGQKKVIMYQLKKAFPIVLGMLFLFLIHDIQAQVKRDSSNTSLRRDSLKNSSIVTNSSQPAPAPPNVLVNFSSKDSLRIRLKGSRIATLFGSAKVEHKSGSLSSGKIGLDLDKNVMSAQASNAEDTLSQPVLTRESETLRSHRVLFNYKTEQGKFEEARMKYDQGNIIGTEVKNKTEHVVFIRDGKYSTCELDHPHYYIKAEKMKVVDEEEVFFTNARLYLLDIPYPLILPFGYVPAKIDQKQSGLLSPTYAFQTQSQQGLGIQNLGWFQYINDYVTAKVSTSIFTSGTFNADAETNYAIRDQLSGSFRFGYAQIQGLESSDPDFTKSVSNSLSIRHNQTINPYSSFDANVNLRSSSYYRNVSYDVEDRAEISTNSSVGYSYREPNSLYNFSARMGHSQNFANNSVSLTGPNMSFRFKQFQPFQAPVGTSTGQPGPLESISISVGSQLDSRFTYNPLAGADEEIDWFDALLSPSKFREATGRKIPIQWGVTNRLSFSSRLIPSEVVNVNGSASLNEYWHPYTIRAYYDTTKKSRQFNVVNGFSAARDFNLSVSLNTKLYGIANPNIGSLKSIRHTILPSISFSYNPNFQSEAWGYYKTYSQPNSNGSTSEVKYSIYEQGISGTGFGQESRAISFGFNNILESKLVSRDSLGEKKERVIKLIDSWSFQSSYNFMAQQFKLSPLSSSISSSIIDNINLRASASFSFYATDSAGRDINTYLWDARKKPFRLTNFQFSTGTRFKGGKKSNVVNEPYYNPREYDPLNQNEFLPQNPMFYSMDQIDFSAPWSIAINFSYSWRKSLQKITRSAVLNASSIQFNPAPKWNVSTTMGYDFIRQKLTPNQIRISRNVHCWDLNFVWNPFSPRGQSYYLFSLTVNSAQFQSLFQKLPGLNNLERSSSRIPVRGFGF